MVRCIVRTCLCVSEDAAVVEGDLQLDVLAMEVVLQAVEIAGTFPLAHWKVVEQVVTAGLWLCGGHFVLREYPLETLDGQASHVFNGVLSCHDDIHTREAPHGTYINHILLRLAVAEPCSHEMLKAVNSGRSNGRFLVWFGDTQVESGEPSVYARHIDAGLQVCVVDCETLYNFHVAYVMRFQNYSFFVG